MDIVEIMKVEISRLDEARRRLLAEELERILQILIARVKPHKVILFGSMAAGEVGEWSDIDLVVVQETSQPFWKRVRSLRELLRPQVGLDLLVYTPEEFAKLRQDRSFFQEQILSQGRVIYDRQG